MGQGCVGEFLRLERLPCFCHVEREMVRNCRVLVGRESWIGNGLVVVIGLKGVLDLRTVGWQILCGELGAWISALVLLLP